MKRIATIFTLMLVVALFSVVLAGCGKKEKAPSNTTAVVTNNPSNSNNNEEKQEVSFNIGNEFSGDDIPLTDLSMSYKGNPTDEEGKLNAPFDVVYKEAFDTGAFKYDESAILIKMPTEYDGELLDDFKKVGITSITDFSTAKNGVWYKATLSEDVDVKTAIQQVRSLSYVLMADFDYIYESEAIKTTTPSLMQDTPTVDGLITDVLQNSMVQNQWYLGACSIIESWKFLQSKGISAGGSSSVVVAVIDTGVDYTHSDLKANMWTNSQEIPNNGRDDDGNGYIDDYYGVDMCATNNGGSIQDIADPMDDHGHGTHVAGIIAASNNKQGIVGIAYNAKIMAVKAGQASGIFLQSDIAKAILYAYQMGADVINMSFGGSACSIAMQDALDQAYTTSTLVASAGNDGLPNEYRPAYPIYLPNYPAALSYVIGVMSVDRYGRESSFSNYDVLGYNSVEYEVYAPGEQILSTLPNERYGYLSGTSMAAPIVSAIAGLLRSYFTDRDMYPSKYIAAQICSTSELSAMCLDPRSHGLHNIPMIVNGYAAFTKVPKPDVTLFNYFVYDSVSISETNNGDGIVDSGETVDIGLVLRNRWGMSKDTIVTIDALSDLGVENPYVELLTSEINFNGVGTYSTKDNLLRDDENIVTGVELPLKVKVSKDCPNDYLIVLNVHINCKNALDEEDQTTYSNDAKVSFAIRNGVVLPSQITEDMVLTKDNYYIIPNSTYIAEGVTVTVEPGTKIQFWTNDPNDAYADSYIAYLNVAGSFIVNGSEEEPVEMFPSELMGQYIVDIKKTGNGYVELNYTSIINPSINAQFINHCFFTTNYSQVLYRLLNSSGRVGYTSTSCYITSNITSNSIFYKIGGNYCYLYGYFDSCIFTQSNVMENYYNTRLVFENCVFLGYNRYFPLDYYGLSMDVSKVIKNSETGKTYIMLYMNADSIFYQKLSHNFITSFGSLCSIDDEDEYLFLKENNMRGYVSAYNLTDEWIGGGKITIDEMYDAPGLFKSFRDQPISYTSHANYLLEISGSIYLDTIQLNEYETSIDLESIYMMRPIIYPTTYEGGVKYVSSNESIITVDENGVVTPLRKGEAYVYVYSEDYVVNASCKFNVVEKVKTKSIKLSIDNSQLNIGTSIYATTTFTPYNATERDVEYYSSDENVATISSNGLIRAIGVGNCNISARLGELVSAVEISVVSPVESIEFEDRFYVTYIGDTNEDWKPTVLPVDATNKKIVWYSSNPEVAYVNENDELVRLSEGFATLRAVVQNTNLFDELTISVNNENYYNNLNILYAEEKDGLIVTLDSNYNVWAWGAGFMRTPKLLCSGYKSISINSYYNGGNSFSIYAVNVNGNLDLINYGSNSSTVEINYNIYSLSNCKKVVSSGNSSYVLMNDNTVWSWGNNNYMQLGDGTFTDRYGGPIQSDAINIKDIYAGDYCLFTIDYNDHLYCFGGNSYKRELCTKVQKIFKYARDCLVFMDDNGTWYCSYGSNYNPSVIDNFWYNNRHFTFISEDNCMYCSGSNVTIDADDIKCMSPYYLLYEDNNKIYAIGENSNFELANLSRDDDYSKPNRIYFGLNIGLNQMIVRKTNIEYLYSEDQITNDIAYLEEKTIVDANQKWRSSYESYSFDYSNEEYTLVSFNKNNKNDYFYNTYCGFDKCNTNIMLFEMKGSDGDTITFIPNGEESFSQTFSFNNERQLFTISIPSNLSNLNIICNKESDKQNGNVYIYKANLFTYFCNDCFIDCNENTFFQYDNEAKVLQYNKTDAYDGLTIDFECNINPYIIIKSNGYNQISFVYSINSNEYSQTVECYDGEYCYYSFSEIEKIKISPIGYQGSVFLKIIIPDDNNSFFDHICTNQRLEIDFNTKILSSYNYGYVSLMNDKGEKLSIQKELFLNKLYVSPVLNLEVGKIYTIQIPSNSLETIFGVSNDNINYTFKYINDMGIELLSTSIENNKTYNELFNTIALDYTSARDGDNYSSIVLEDSNGPIEINKSLFNNQLVISFSPTYSSYKLTIPEGALKDCVGGQNENTIINFTIADTLKLLSQNIHNNDERVDEEKVFTFKFNDIETSDNYNSITILDSNGLAVETNLTFENDILSINHSLLSQGATYSLIIPADSFKDQLGNSNDPIEINFSVYEPVRMLYSSMSSIDVALSPTIQFEYNGVFTLDDTKVHIYDAVLNEIGCNIEQFEKIVRITPNQSLVQGSNYRLVLEEGFVTDERGVKSSQYEYEFGTIKQNERFYYTRDYILSLLVDWKNDGYESILSNCAILNNLNETNVENWFRINAYGNGKYGISGNYWGTTNEYMIEKQIVDFDDYQSLGDIILGSYLLEGNEQMYPFITDVSIYNVNGEKVKKVSNETIKVVIKFNRDMDITENLRVRFGSSTPYAEYEIPGDFVSARQWEGTYTLKTTIENGNQFFNITGGRADSNHFLKLYEHSGRWMFEVDTASAQAMIMQGVATSEGIELTWEQDDFDTLAGYNVYRSTREDGYYTRLNNYVLSPDTKTFFDSAVEPGIVYYYNFTVVKTDLSESDPSGKISIMSLDTMAPNVYHSPVRTAYTNSNLIVSATITDNLQITNAYIYYRVKGATEWKRATMNPINSRYTGLIPQYDLSLEGLEYYICAYDGITYTYNGTSTNPYEVIVKTAINDSQLGDVDGDGVITTKDALMLLQAVNDLLNLTEEQFLRADIDKDGVLTAQEALRILQYVSGKVTSIVG